MMTQEDYVIGYLVVQDFSVEQIKDTEYLVDILECYEFDSETEIDKEYYIELFQKKYLNI